jgi:hypothetical protein
VTFIITLYEQVAAQLIDMRVKVRAAGSCLSARVCVFWTLVLCTAAEDNTIAGQQHLLCQCSWWTILASSAALAQGCGAWHTFACTLAYPADQKNISFCCCCCCSRLAPAGPASGSRRCRYMTQAATAGARAWPLPCCAPGPS